MKDNLYNKILCFFLSFIIVAFSKPAWIGYLGYLASCLGFCLFWYSIYDISQLTKKLFLAFLWFFLVSSIELSWLSSTRYQGNLIYLVYLFVLCWFAIEFSLISYLVFKDKKIGFLKIACICSIWTIFEWSRLFFICGFSFNQVGMVYANNHYSMQLAAIVGIYGLSFYVIFVNLVALKAFLQKSFNFFFVWALLALFPYIYGIYHENFVKNKIVNNKKIKVCVVQPSFLPEQKNFHKASFDQYIPPLSQWESILSLIKQNKVNDINLIVLPEAVVAYSAYDCFYPFDIVKKIFINIFGAGIEYDLPDLKLPYAINHKSIWYVSNSYFTKALSKIYNAEVIVGFDDFDRATKKSYNSAFYFHPDTWKAEKYQKQILVPIGEYIPFNWLRKIALEKYSIASFFEKGSQTKIFSKENQFACSICYEETYPYIMRKAKKSGAKCFVNLTNDAYFYKSKLYRQHFDHAKLRAVENGTFLIRACNTGVSSIIDPFGNILKAVYEEDKKIAFIHEINLFSYDTVYSTYGEGFIISLCCFFIFAFFLQSFKSSKAVRLES